MSAVSMESLTFKDFVSKGQFEVYKSTLPADHLARAAVEIMQCIRDAGVDHDKWLQDLKVASGWEEDPLKLLHAIAGYESCCRCTIEVQTGEFKAKKGDGAGGQRRDQGSHQVVSGVAMEHF